MAGDNKVGDLSVTLRADTDQFTAGMKQAEAQGDSTARKLDEANDNTVKGFQKSIRAVTSFIGSMTAAIGVAASFYEIGVRIRETWDDLFKTATDRVNEFTNALLTVEPKSLLASTEKELETLKAKVAQALEDVDASPELLQNEDLLRKMYPIIADWLEQIEQLEAGAKSYREQIEAAANASERDKNAKALAESTAKSAIGAAMKAEDDEWQRRRKNVEDELKDIDRIAKQRYDLEEAISEIQRKRAEDQAKADEKRLDALRDQSRELIRQQELFQDLQQRQVGAFGFGGMEATLKAIRGDLQSIRGVIR
jgi:DNA repair exonuclease SbcCD ATPase subunit